MGAGMDAGRVEVLAELFVVVGHLGNWEGGLDALVTSAVVIEVNKDLRLGAKVIFGCKVSGGVMLGRAGN